MNFIAIDFETANQKTESVISIGLVKYLGGKKIDSFYSLVKPQKRLRADYFDHRLTEIHGLDYEDVRLAPMFDALWQSSLKNWLNGKLPLLAHNACFENTRLSALFEKYSIKHNAINYFDSLAIARCVWKNFAHHKLTYLAEQFKIEYDAHNALDDAETCGKIVLLAAQKMKCQSVKELLKLCDLKMKIIGE